MTNRLPVYLRCLTGLGLIVAGLFVTRLTGCSPRRPPSGSDIVPASLTDRTTASSAAPEPSSERARSDAQAVTGAKTRRWERGKAIYLTGKSPSGQPINARLAGSSTDVPAAVLTCGNCHRRDGIGRAEGGITPATITWDELTKDYGPSHPGGRQRPAYDSRSVGRAITMGLDPVGRALDPSMPRYALTREDLDDLVAYLRELGRESDPGITDQVIVVGTLLAPAPSLGALNRAVRSVLTSYFQDVNQRGGIYGRRVELRCLEAPESAQERAAAARRFFKNQEVFALVAPFISGSEDDITAAAQEESIPVLGPFTLYPNSGLPFNRYVFYLHSGLADQMQALAVFAGERLAGQKPAAAIALIDTDAESREVVEVVRTECSRIGWPDVELLAITESAKQASWADQLKATNAQVLFLLAPGIRQIASLSGAAARNLPMVLVPGALVGKEIHELAPVIRDRVFFAFPTLPLDQSREGTAEYERLAATYGLPSEQRSSQIEALAAAKIFVEAMTAAGRSASRETVIEQLEQFYEKPTGLTRPVTFGPNRRFGTRGAYIVGIDPRQSKLVPVSRFIEPPSR